MAAEHHLHSADDGEHSAGCGLSHLTTSIAIPVTPLRWLVVGCIGLAVFGLFSPLSPIPPCPLRTMTGIPCPLCGMTRSVRELLRLDLGAAMRFQPFGLIALLGGAAILVLWALPRTRAVSVVRVPVLAALLMLAGSWIWNIGFNPTFS